MIFNEIRSRLNGSVEKFESMRGSSIQSPVSFSLTNRGFFTGDPRHSRGGGRIFSGGGRWPKKNWKNTSFDFAVYPCRGTETTVQELFRPSRGRLSGFLRDEPAPFPSPPFGEIWDLGRALRSRDRGSSLIELKKKTRKIARRSTEARVAFQSLDD